MARNGRLTLSKSSMGRYLECPKSYWFSYLQNLPSLTDYPRLTGTEVHKFIAKLHSSKNNPLYYKDINSARRAWFWTWKQALDKYEPIMHHREKKNDDDFGKAGWFCIRNYWIQNIGKPKPLAVEKRYTVPISGNLSLVGIFDQIRRIPLEKIKKIRPDLIENERLKEGYDPVVIIDLKTGKETYDPRPFNPEIDLKGMAAYQFELHQDLQVTMYYKLYYEATRHLPVGFYWYHLRDGKAFLTYRTKEDFVTLEEIVEHVYNGINDERFAPHVAPHCKRCDFVEACVAIREGRPMLVSEPSDGIGEGEAVESVTPEVELRKSKQLRFKFMADKSLKGGKIPKTTDKEAFTRRPTIVVLPNNGNDTNQIN